MNSLLWMALYYAGIALFAMIMIGETIYRFWIIELGEKARLYEEMCERLEGLDSVEWW
jgi:uncharacterized membrane-anchored protein YhcB (DUF1043 family)